MKNLSRSFFGIVFIGLTTTAWVHASCEDVEAPHHFATAGSARLLASYLNYTPVPRSGVGAKAERDDDQFGVCRIFSDGSVITSFGCAGHPHILKAHLAPQDNLNSFLSYLQTTASLDLKISAESFNENLYLRDYAENMFAAFGDHQYLVQKDSPLSEIIRTICPLDNQPNHKKWVQTTPSRTQAR